jgi:hypothetical protein
LFLRPQKITKYIIPKYYIYIIINIIFLGYIYYQQKQNLTDKVFTLKIMDDEMEMTYRQVTCQKAVNGDNFSSGVQDYNFSIGGKTAWIPNKTYFRIGLKLTGKGGAAVPRYQEQIALADSVCGNLYNNIYFRAGGQDVSSIVSYIPQAAAVKNRLDKSGSWMNSFGRDAYFLDPDFKSRVERTSKANYQNDETTQYISLGDIAHQENYSVKINTEDDRPNVSSIGTDYVALGVKVGDKLLVNGTVYTVTDESPITATSLSVTPIAISVVDTGLTGTARKITVRDDGDGRNVVYAMFQPPIGIFDVEKPMGSGDFRMSLNPNAYFKTSAVEMTKKGLPVTDFDIEVMSVELYVATCKMDVLATGEDDLRLLESQIQSKTLTNTSGDNTLDFTVPPSTKALTIFVQSGEAGQNTMFPPSMFKAAGGTDMNLNSIQISYANQTKPSTRWTSEYDTNTNKMTQRYLETQLESGKIWSAGGGESFSDYVKRGPLYHFSWSRDKDDRSSQVQVAIGFNGAGIAPNTNLFVVAHYTKTSIIGVKDGYITEVISKAV